MNLPICYLLPNGKYYVLAPAGLVPINTAPELERSPSSASLQNHLNPMIYTQDNVTMIAPCLS